MKDRRREVESWTCSDKFVIEKGERADIVLEHMPRNFMMCDPIIIGKDDDGLVVEWCYNKVILTLARATGEDAVFGKITAYTVYKIYEIIPMEEVDNV
jgi:hypothetical protein